MSMVEWLLEAYGRGDDDSMTLITKYDLSYFIHWCEDKARIWHAPYLLKCIKEIRNHTTRYICGDPLKVSSVSLGLTHDGLPKALGPLVPIIRRRNPQDLRFVMTILTLTKLDLGNGQLDTTSIESPYSGSSEKLYTVSEACESLLGHFINTGEIKVPRDSK
jgi:hypothetical protein